MSESGDAAERLRLLQPKLKEALKIWREFKDSGWKKHANTPQLLDAANVMAHACDYMHTADEDELISAKRRMRWKITEFVYVEAFGNDVKIVDESDYQCIELPITKCGQLQLLLRALK